jgi:Protein of unknown function (DUF3638)
MQARITSCTSAGKLRSLTPLALLRTSTLQLQHQLHAFDYAGEGKTSVIVPMLAAALSDGAAVTRITVPAPLFHSNAALLAHKPGGLLGRRVCTLPCRRDMVLGANEASDMCALVHAKLRAVILQEWHRGRRVAYVEHAN